MIGDAVKEFFLGAWLWNLLMLMIQIHKVMGCNIFSAYFLFWFNDNGNAFEACLA